MAVYCDTSDVIALAPRRELTTSTEPTTQQASSYIVWITAEMNVRMSAVGISAPISTSPATSASQFLKLTCAYGATGLFIQNQNFGSSKDDNKHGAWLYGLYKDKMKMIEKEPALITGTGGAIFDSYEYSNSDEARSQEDEPYPRNEKVW